MARLRIWIKAVYCIDPGNIDTETRSELAKSYLATRESPEPDDEWFAEELALRRIGDVGLEFREVVDLEPADKTDDIYVPSSNDLRLKEY